MTTCLLHLLALLHVAHPGALWPAWPLTASAMVLAALPVRAIHRHRASLLSGLEALSVRWPDVLSSDDRGYAMRLDMVRSARMKKPCAYAGSVSPP